MHIQMFLNYKGNMFSGDGFISSSSGEQTSRGMKDLLESRFLLVLSVAFRAEINSDVLVEKLFN